MSAVIDRRRRRLLTAGALAGCATLAGCGFHLRRSAELPFKSLYAGFSSASPIGAEFKRMARLLGETRIVDKPEEAEVKLEVLNELREREIVGFSNTGRPREYQLRYRFDFRLVDAKNAVIIPPTSIVLRRDITTTDTQLAAKQQEEVLLYREMQSDMVQQVLRRLAAVKRSG